MVNDDNKPDALELIIVSHCKAVTSDGDREPLAATTDYFSCDMSRLSTL